MATKNKWNTIKINIIQQDKDKDKLTVMFMHKQYFRLHVYVYLMENCNDLKLCSRTF